MLLAEDQQMIEALAAQRACEPFREKFARGRAGVLMTCVPLRAKASSNAMVNLLSRSCIRNRKRLARSPRSMSRLRVCWVVQALVEWAVTPRRSTARVWVFITNTTCTRGRTRYPRPGRRMPGFPRPGRPGIAARPVMPARRGLQPGGAQDPAYRSIPDTEAEELALDAPVSPARVLPG